MKPIVLCLIIPMLAVACLIPAVASPAPIPPTSTPAPLSATATLAPSLTFSPSPSASFTPIPTQPPLPSATATAMLSPTPAPSSTIFPLEGVVFFDYNGDGLQDDGEPPVPGALVQVDGLQAISGVDGAYHLDLLGEGTKSATLQASGFNFIAVSSLSFYWLDEGVAIEISSGARHDFGLMQGFLTLPFRGDYPVHRMYDHNPEAGILWWDGNTTCLPEDDYCHQAGGADGQYGTDFGMPAGGEVLAAAAGAVRHVNIAGCNSILIDHDVSVGGRPLLTLYAHLSKTLVKTGNVVNRGQVIGLSGDVCGPYPHLHFDLRSLISQDDDWAILDPFKPILEVPIGFWQDSYKKPLAFWSSAYHPAANLGWWTVENAPQHPASP